MSATTQSFATVLVFAIWGHLFRKYSAANVAPFFLLVPVFGMSLSGLILGERLSHYQMVGAGMIFFGLVICSLDKEKELTISIDRQLFLKV